MDFTLRAKIKGRGNVLSWDYPELKISTGWPLPGDVLDLFLVARQMRDSTNFSPFDSLLRRLLGPRAGRCRLSDSKTAHGGRGLWDAGRGDEVCGVRACRWGGGRTGRGVGGEAGSAPAHTRKVNRGLENFVFVPPLAARARASHHLVQSRAQRTKLPQMPSPPPAFSACLQCLGWKYNVHRATRHIIGRIPPLPAPSRGIQLNYRPKSVVSESFFRKAGPLSNPW